MGRGRLYSRDPADARPHADQSFRVGARILFTGDCLITEYLPNLDAGTPADWQVWLDSLQRIKALEPTVVVPGHGPVARGAEVQAIVDSVRRVHRP
jgi:glyoxylase-like metal-dependent hydrolase (beta-lactamase superfamily II)